MTSPEPRSPRPGRILVVDDDAANVAVLHRMLERSGYEDIITTQDSRAVIGLFEQFQPDLVLLDLHMPQPDGYALLARFADVIEPADLVPVIVLTADASFDAKERALGAGAHDFVTKPFHFPELALRVRNALELRARHRELRSHDAEVTAELADRMRSDRELAARWQQARDRIEEILAGSGLSMAFQPIVDMTDGTIVGTEALSRFSAEPRRGPDVWFAEAAEVALAVDLELRSVALALRAVDELPDDSFLSVNASAATIMSHGFADLLSTTDPSRLVVELTEHEQVEDYGHLLTMLAPLRSRGLRLAVDDTGSGWSSLQHILRLSPDIIKLDRELIVGVDADPGRRALIASMLHFAAEMGSVVVAEGIETVPELTTLCDLGVRNGQGYLMARPAPLPLSISPFIAEVEAVRGPCGVGTQAVLQRAVDVLCEQSDTLESIDGADAAEVMRMQLRETITACRRVILEIDELVAAGVPSSGAGGAGRGDADPEPVDFRCVFEQSPAMFLLLDPDLRIIGASNAYLAGTGTQREAIVGRRLFDVFPNDPGDPAADWARDLAVSLDRVRFGRVVDNMPLQKYDVRRPDREGGGFEAKYWSPVNLPVLDASGSLVAILHRVEDVTDLVRLHDTLEHLAPETAARAGGAGLEQSLFLRGRDLERAHDRLIELDGVRRDVRYG